MLPGFPLISWIPDDSRASQWELRDDLLQVSVTVQVADSTGSGAAVRRPARTMGTRLTNVAIM